jgi:adenine-specific DNA-methyltransferase
MEHLFGEKNVFSNPKPVELIDGILSVSNTKNNDIVMDFFAGSGTTGHAVMAQNAADGGNRRYILVQLPEPLDPENKDQKVAAEFCDKLGKPRTIAELTKERLRRAAKKIREELEVRRQELEKKESPLLTSPSSLHTPDLGFRVFKLDSSNIRAWDPDRENLDKTLLDSVEHLKPGRTEADVLYELLLKLGLDLCVPIEKREVRREELEGGSHTIHAVGGGVLMACLSEKIGRKDVEAVGMGIVEWHKELAPAGDTTCVFRDSAFADDVAKTNLAAILEQHGIANVRSL